MVTDRPGLRFVFKNSASYRGQRKTTICVLLTFIFAYVKVLKAKTASSQDLAVCVSSCIITMSDQVAVGKKYPRVLIRKRASIYTIAYIATVLLAPASLRT